MASITDQARGAPKRIVFPEGEEEKVLRAAQIVADEGIAHPIVIGRPEVIKARGSELGLDLAEISVVNPASDARLEGYVDMLWKMRRRKGITRASARKQMRGSRTAFGMMMVNNADADGLVGGVTAAYPATIRPALQIIGTRPDVDKAAGMYIVITPGHVKFLADTHRQHRARRRDAGADGDARRRYGARVGDHAAHRHAVLFQFRRRAAPPEREGRQGHLARQSPSDPTS